ncbi:hypothetical protein KX928_14090 [Roseobacter sp. YSTF-M11]|uniref:Uncharacterized protein n=1 Tax=Roseobacter insulae TaxID=2859783 RepID=A0A9X1JZ64_9RHOB|nr:hypothetical protein [Roseobacter insulae]MBW4708915.1 hypothetical protein [Roseobacter insulae]
MSELTEQDKTEEPKNRQGAPTAAERATLQSDLEERLAAARIEREKVLAAKGKSDKKPIVKRPRFMDGEDGFGAPVYQKGAGTPQQPPESVTPDVAGARKSARFALLAPQGNGSQARTAVPQKSGLSLSRVAAIGFACFFGLGFGMVLSLGAVMGLGWVTLSDVADRIGNPGQRLLSQQAPDVADQIDLTLAAALPATAALSMAQLAHRQTLPTPPALPLLAAAPVPDTAPGAVLSPGPRLNTIGKAVTAALQPDASIAPITVSFENPTRGLITPMLSVSQSDDLDSLPVIFELSPVHLLSSLGDLTSPDPDKSRVTAVSATDGQPTRMTIPALFRSAAGHRPSEVENDPVIVPLFSAVIEGWAAVDVSAPSTALRLAAIEPSPDALPPVSLLARPATANPLPAISGPVLRVPDLASKLGFSGDKAKSIALVTYAPSSVTNTELAERLKVLETTGFPLASTNRVNFKVSKTHVRYYTRADETVARAVAAEVGGKARDFTRERISSPSGRIEIWLAGTRTGVAKQKRTSQSVSQRRANLKAELKNRLINSLRRGEHLGSAQP